MSRFFANLFVFFFVSFGVLALSAFTLEGVLFAPETYQRALDRADVYERLPAVIAGQLSESFSETTESIKPEDLQTVLRAALPAKDLQVFADDALAQFFGFLNGKTSIPRLSTVKLKEILKTNLVEAFFSLLASKPPCTEEQLADLTVNTMIGDPVNALDCKPSDKLLNEFRPALTGLINAQVDNLPDTISFFPENHPDLTNAFARLRAVRAIIRLALLLPLGCLLIITLLVVRSFKDLLEWWGKPLAATGLITAILGLAAALLARVLAEAFVTNALKISVAVDLGALIRDLLFAVSAQVWTPLIVVAVLLLVLGLAMKIGVRYIHPVDERLAPEV